MALVLRAGLILERCPQAARRTIRKLESTGRESVLHEELKLAANPYIIGRWVRGADHYGRQSLLDYLMTAQENAFWVVGARRMGKTSLLRQLEYLVDNRESRYLPLYWNLQGCSSAADLADDLGQVVEDASVRLAGMGANLSGISGTDGSDALKILRTLSRAAAAGGRRLLLLVDEAGVLVQLAEQDSAWIARLYKLLQEGRQRTIIVSTKLPAQATCARDGKMLEPLLSGFHILNLQTLSHEDAVELVHQTQSNQRVTANDALVEQILHLTNSHPYLIHHLCHQLYVPGIGGGSLRRIADEDLRLDPMVAGYLRADFMQLAPLERQVLLAAADADALDEEDLCERLGGCAEGSLEPVVAKLVDLGFLRRAAEGYMAGNQYLQRWLHEKRHDLVEELVQESATGVSEDSGEVDPDGIAALAHSLGISTARILEFAKPGIASEAEFEAAVKGLFYETRHLVEQDDGYKLLVTTDAQGKTVLRSEEDVQIALKHWLRPMCRALNIHMERGSSTGRGFLDFAFSIGHDFRCLVEIKPFHSLRLQEGVGIQLPTYMIADRVKYGIYVPIFLESADHAAVVEELERVAQERGESHGVKIDVMDIRAWKPETASKADVVEVRNRYQPDGLFGRKLAAAPGKHGHHQTQLRTQTAAGK